MTRAKPAPPVTAESLRAALLGLLNPPATRTEVVRIGAHVHEAPAYLMDTVAAAKYLGIGTTQLDELRRAGKIPAKKWGNNRRYLRADLEAWADAQPYDAPKATEPTPLRAAG